MAGASGAQELPNLCSHGSIKRAVKLSRQRDQGVISGVGTIMLPEAPKNAKLHRGPAEST